MEMSNQQDIIIPFIEIVGIGEEERGPKSGKILERVGDWLTYQNTEEWVKDRKGSLGLMDSIIATMTFQLSTNPH